MYALTQKAELVKEKKNYLCLVSEYLKEKN